MSGRGAVRGRERIAPGEGELLGRTDSVCPDCLAVIPAAYVAREDGVYLEKRCPDHGGFAVLVWTDAKSFAHWQRRVAGETDPPAGDCPRRCGLCGDHLGQTCCVLLEVTARCDLACPVCFAATDAPPGEDPDLETVGGWYDMLMASGGPYNIQLSGGEPTMRDDLPALIRLGRERGFSFFQLNTNGLRLAREPDYARALKEAGLSTVFLQFDGLEPASALRLRGRDLTADKRRAVAVCAELGLGVVLVPTVVRGCNDRELGAILRYAAENMPAVRGVHFQPASFFGRYAGCDPAGDRMIMPELLQALEAQTGGLVRAADFLPGNAEHPLCSFHADYTVDGGRWTLRESRGEGCCGVSSARAREAVARKWSAPEPEAESCCGGVRVDALDAFLKEREERTLALSGMAFQDAWTLDLRRLRRCYIQTVSPDGRLVPFCAYNLTGRDGRALAVGRGGG